MSKSNHVTLSRQIRPSLGHMQKDSSVQVLGWLEGKSGASRVTLSIPTTREVKVGSLDGQSRVLGQSVQLSEALSKIESQRGLRM